MAKSSQRISAKRHGAVVGDAVRRDFGAGNLRCAPWLGVAPPSGDESESAMNALTILQHGVPRGEYLGLPIYENTLTEFWPDNPEYEFRDSSYSPNGVAIYHGWLAALFDGVVVQVLRHHAGSARLDIHVRHTLAEMQRRTIAARLPSVVFGAVS